MARVCERCGYYAADAAAGGCPTCGGALKFTLLPPPGVEPPPLEGVATRPIDRPWNDYGTVNGDAADPPRMLSGYVPAEYRGLLAFFAVVATVAAIVTVVTTR